MSTIKDNSNYEKTSFLSKSNSSFIESMYLKYINDEKELPHGWRDFFESLGEQKKDILREVNLFR